MDLSLRATQYEMTGLYYREFLRFSELADFETISLKELLKSHSEIALDLSNKFKPLQYFNDYLRHGYILKGRGLLMLSQLPAEASAHCRSRIRSFWRTRICITHWMPITPIREAFGNHFL